MDLGNKLCMAWGDLLGSNLDEMTGDIGGVGVCLATVYESRQRSLGVLWDV